MNFLGFALGRHEFSGWDKSSCLPPNWAINVYCQLWRKAINIQINKSRHCRPGWFSWGGPSRPAAVVPPVSSVPETPPTPDISGITATPGSVMKDIHVHYTLMLSRVKWKNSAQERVSRNAIRPFSYDVYCKGTYTRHATFSPQIYVFMLWRHNPRINTIMKNGGKCTTNIIGKSILAGVKVKHATYKRVTDTLIELNLTLYWNRKINPYFDLIDIFIVFHHKVIRTC